MSLDPRIKTAGVLAETAFKELKEIQTGKKSLAKTGQEFIDSHIGGMLPSDIILAAAPSGVGKTQMMYDIFEKYLDEDINPNADKYVTLEFSLEMLFLSKILRESHSLLKKKKSEILSNTFTDEERQVISAYYKSLQDGRRFLVEESITTKDFYDICKNFCEINSGKEKILIGLDHVLLVQKSDKNEDPLERLATYLNMLRKEFSNVNFILLSQLNRSYLTNVAEKSNLMIPTVSTIYGSSHFEFLASFIFVMLNPFKMGVNEYLKVSENRHEHLSEFATAPDAKGKVSFNTLGNLFIHTLKTRESDNPYLNLHIKKMDLSSEQLTKMKQEQEDNTKTNSKDISLPNIPSFSPPTIDMTIFEKEDIVAKNSPTELTTELF